MFQLNIEVRFLIFALVASVALMALVATPLTLAPAFGITRPSSLMRLFNLDGEANVPTWIATVQLLIASGLLWALAQAPGVNYRARWKLLSFLFLYISLDEASQMHEMLIYPLREGLGLGGMFYFAWVVPAIPVAAFLVYWYWAPVMSVPGSVKAMAIGSAASYLSGALGIEMIGGAWADARGGHNVTYAVLTSLEELLELAGVALWNCALLKYLDLCFRKAPQQAAAGAAQPTSFGSYT